MRALYHRLGESLAAFGGVAANPSLRRVELAFAGSDAGSWVATIAISVLFFERSGAAGVGLVIFLQTAAAAVAAPFMGVLADRFSRKRVMIGSDLIRVAILAALAVAVYAEAPVGLLYTLAPLVSVVSTAFRPAQAAILPSLARTPEELTAANVASSTIESVSAFAGPAVGGVLVAVADLGVSFAATAGTYALSAALLLGIEPGRSAEGLESAGESDRDRHPSDSSRDLLGEVLAGAQAIRRDSRLFLLISLMGAQVVVAGSLFVLVVPLAFDRLDLGEGGFGTLMAALGVGGLVGAAIAVTMIGRRLSHAFGIGVVLWGAPIALLALWQSTEGALLLLGLVGLANTLVDVSGYTLLQRAVPDQVLARVFGILESVLYGGIALGAIVTPPLIAGIGLEATFVAAGLLLPALVLLTWRRLTVIDDEAPRHAEELGLLRGVPFLAPLPPPTLEHLAGVLTPLSFEPGATVFREGAPGDRFYVVAEGEGQVSIDGKLVRRLGVGDFFGEIALLRDVPRTATVTVPSGARLLALEREEFVGAVTGYSESAEAADAVVAAWLSARRPVGSPV